MEGEEGRGGKGREEARSSERRKGKREGKERKEMLQQQPYWFQ